MKIYQSILAKWPQLEKNILLKPLSEIKDKKKAKN